MSGSFRKFLICNEKLISREKFEFNSIAGHFLIYEVLKIIDGKPLFFPDHMERFINSIRLTNKDYHIDPIEIAQLLKRLITSNRVKLGNVKFLLSFKKGEKKPENFLMFFIKHNYPTKDQINNGVAVSFLSAVRENPNAKIFHNQLRNKIVEIIERNKLFEVLLVDQNDNVTEGHRTNFFAIKENTLFTPLHEDVLPGITRKYVLEIAKNIGMIVKEQKISVSMLIEMDSLFLSSTSSDVIPINCINGKSIPNTNVWLSKIMSAFQDVKKANAVWLKNY